MNTNFGCPIHRAALGAMSGIAQSQTRHFAFAFLAVIPAGDLLLKDLP
jgi:hypothetical protein